MREIAHTLEEESNVFMDMRKQQQNTVAKTSFRTRYGSVMEEAMRPYNAGEISIIFWTTLN